MTPAEIKAAIWKADDRPVEEVLTPEWAAAGLASVCVVGMMADDRDWFDQIQNEKRYPVDDDGNLAPERIDYRGLRSALLSRTWCTPDGKLLGFTELEISKLGEKSGAAIDRIYRRARDLSGLGEDAVEKAKKNSPPTPGENS